MYYNAYILYIITRYILVYMYIYIYIHFVVIIR